MRLSALGACKDPAGFCRSYAMARLRQSASHDLTDTAASLDIPVELRLVTDGQDISAYLSRVEQGFLRLSTPVALLNDLRVEVAIDGCTIRAEVGLVRAAILGQVYSRSAACLRPSRRNQG